MRRLIQLGFLASLMVIGIVCSAIADPIDLGIFSMSGSSNPDSELTFLNGTVIPQYNSSNPNNLLPMLDPEDYIFSKKDYSGDPTTIQLDITGWTYLVLKSSTKWQFYYLDSSIGIQTFVSEFTNKHGNIQAFSHSTLLDSRTSVPEPNSLLLLGSGILAFGFAGRRWFKS